MSEKTWNKADLHVHTLHSDGSDDIRTLLAYTAQHTDISILAITDHDRVDGALLAHRLAPTFGLEVIVGEEVSTSRGHLLALYIQESISPGMSIPETVRQIHAQGGLAVLAHPFDYVANSPMRHWPHPKIQDWHSFGLDALEGLNGGQFLSPNPLAAMLVSKRLGIPLTGGSDAHHKQVIGTASTCFPGHTAADLRHAIVKGTCRPSGGRWPAKGYWNYLAKSVLPRALWRAPMPIPASDFGRA